MAEPKLDVLVDWLGFTLRGVLSLGLLRGVLPLWVPGVEIVPRTGGLHGYEHSAKLMLADVALGMIAWGGNSDTVYCVFTGTGCKRLDLLKVREWLEYQSAKLTRVDVAADDLEGGKASVEWAEEQWKSGGFNCGGRDPQSQKIDDMGSRRGSTFNVGSRRNGKTCRVYEKGKQLGDPLSPWVRIEVEWHSTDRIIPYDILTEPGKYLAGAYPCLGWLDCIQCTIRCVKRQGEISLTFLCECARLAYGKLVSFLLETGKGAQEIVEMLERPGRPARLAI